MLCTSARPFTLDSLVIVIAVYPKNTAEKQAHLEELGLGKKAVLTVHDPFKVKEDKQIIPTIVTTFANISSVKKKQNQRTSD